MANARSKVVFSLEGEENLKPLAQSLFMGVLNPDEVKLKLYSRKVMDYAEESRTIESESENWSEGVGVFTGQTDTESAGGAISDGAEANHGYVREEGLETEITALLKPFSLRADWADEMLKRVKEEKKQSAQSDALMAGQKRGEIEKINLRLQKLLDSFLDEIIDRDTYVAEKAKLMSQKKSLEEQSTALLKGRANWLEPFQSWILTARNAGEIAVNGSPQEKRALAQKVFGSNLVLDCKKARGSCVKPWSLPTRQLVKWWNGAHDRT